jgi:hypothetical protein
MPDVIFLILIVAFFALMALLVKACDVIIGPDELAATAGDDLGRDSSTSSGRGAEATS